MPDYYDLDLPESNCQLTETITRLVQNKIFSIAVSKTFDIIEFDFDSTESTNGVNKKKRKAPPERRLMRDSIRGKLALPCISNCISEEARRIAQIQGKTVTLFTRLTLICNASILTKSFIREFQSEINAFDILAVQPFSEEVLNYACETMSVDIITLNLWQKPEYKFNYKLLKLAIKSRGLFLEIKLVPLLSSSACRIYTISFITDMIEARCANGMIFSSSARDSWDVRNPLSIVCVAKCLGFTGYLANLMMTANCQSVVQHALIRKKTVFGAMAILKLQGQPGVKLVESISANSASSNEPPEKKLKQK